MAKFNFPFPWVNDPETQGNNEALKLYLDSLTGGAGLAGAGASFPAWSDDFTTDRLSSYTGDTTAFTVSGGLLIPGSGPGLKALLVPSFSVVSGRVDVKVSAFSGGPDSISLILRWRDANNYLRFYQDVSTMNIFKVIGGTQTSIASVAVGLAIAGTRWYRFYVSGEAAECLRYSADPSAGTYVAPDASITIAGGVPSELRGREGLMGLIAGLTGATTTTRFDDFKIGLA